MRGESNNSLGPPCNSVVVVEGGGSFVKAKVAQEQWCFLVKAVTGQHHLNTPGLTGDRRQNPAPVPPPLSILHLQPRATVAVSN